MTALTLAADSTAMFEAVDAVSLDLYVAEDGDDASTNPCTAIDTPCLTVSGAVTRAQTAITNGAADVTVNIAAGTYPENVSIGSVASGSSLSLVGDAASTTTIHGDGTASVISITSGMVNVTGLSITGGDAVDGGGIYDDAGTVTITGSTVSGNTATGSDKLAGGGGIYNNAGTLTVSGSTVSGNTATVGYAGGIYNNTGTVTVSDDSTLSDNTGWYVGGIHNRGTLNVLDSTVSNNTATKNFGGGISNYGGTLTVSDSTLSGNSATNLNTGDGGAIYNKGPATVTNSTLSGNSAYQGGGIYTQSKLLTVSNSTLSDNTQTYSSEGKVAPGGGIWVSGHPGVNISNSILSGSSCSQISTLVDGGYNVSDDSCFWEIGDTSIQDSTTIGLTALAANGSTGPQTMAIDATSSAHHLVPTCTGTDERGMDRPGFGGTANCDAGAYELQGTGPTVTTDPQSQTVAIGSDATFTAAASGTPGPTVKWQVNTGSAWAGLSGATATTLTLTSVTHALSGNQYRAVFTNGVAPDATTAAATLTVPAAVPGAPTDLTAVAGDGSVSLSWSGTPTGSDGGSTVTGYNVYEGSASGTEGSAPVNAGPLSAAATSYAVTGLTNGTAYYFTVKAVNLVGSSDASNEATATPVASSSGSGTSGAPGTPTPPASGGGVLQPANGDGVNLTWPAGVLTDGTTVVVTPLTRATGGNEPAGFAVGTVIVNLTVAGPGGGPVTSFAEPLVLHFPKPPTAFVPAYSHDGVTWTAIPKLGAPALPAGQPDGYFVETDGSVDIYTRHATEFGLLHPAIPAAPTALHASLGAGRLRLRWTPPSGVGLGVAGYTVLLNGKPIATVTGTSAAIHRFDTHGLGRYEVVAKNAVGEQSEASEAIATRPVVRPKAAPRRIPAWAWRLLAWQHRPAAHRGHRPAAAPKHVPHWYAAWNHWRRNPVRL